MKNTAFFALAASFVFCACAVPEYTRITDVIQNDSASDEIPKADTSGNSDTGSATDFVTVENVAAKLPADYMRGFDASYVDYYENENKYVYSDTDGTEKDFFQILSAHGINTVRLRIWVDPTDAVKNGITTDIDFPTRDGDNTLERTIRSAKRAKKAGLKVMLDFHYSDYWTDPGKQVIPHSWQDLTTADKIAAKISEYTEKVLQKMKDENVLPEYVQVGNEIDSGILMHTKYDSKAVPASEEISGKNGSENFAKYVKSGCAAVREFDSGIKIILHVTNRKPAGVIEQLKDSDFDIIGLSYYPWEESHGNVLDLKNNIENLKSTYNKEVVIAECSTYWNYGNYDENKKDLSIAASHLVDPGTDGIYSDLETETVTYNEKETVIVKGTLQNQVNTFRHVIEESALSGANGICAWGGDIRGEWKYAFFDGKGRAMASIDVFSVQGE